MEKIVAHDNWDVKNKIVVTLTWDPSGNEAGRYLEMQTISIMYTG